MNWAEQVVLVTGGTGFFGRNFVELMLQDCHPQKLIIFSRDELKQHLFLERRKRGRITLTDPRMTRFWITLEQGVKFVVRWIEQMHGGEIFVPKIPNMKLTEMAEAIAPGCEVEYIGIRPGEKLHEVLVSEDEARNPVELDDMYVIQSLRSWWRAENWRAGISLPDGFRYTSDSN
jgi:UDP-N-acetylglucosamine 4,6-dehydratase